MMLIVTSIGFLVHLFSLAYMKDDSGKSRYFAGLSIFMFSMTGIVVANNFVMMFIFWELVGFSSYLLIGHWYQKSSAAEAAKKAFLVNRIGDFGFLIGILMLWTLAGSIFFEEMQLPAQGPMLTAAILLVFCGAVGKSAQFPLHVWLPDAMEGPTPVSALIHAATMVAAGVYMLFRLQVSMGIDGAELFTANISGDVIAWVGGFTSLLAALMATQQDDIKKILAYSTLSQLGYMIMAVGLGGGDAGMFHLYTHAWFKALLFLGAGAVIHACHHEQDIWKMGGLLKKMPITGTTFVVGLLALIAFPGTSGFFSKETVLHVAHEHNTALFWVAVAVAVLTPFYMTRLFLVAFMGKNRSDDASHAGEVGPVMFAPLVFLAVMALLAGYKGIHSFSPALPEEAGEFHVNFLFAVSIAAVLIGAGLGFALYRDRGSDPLAANGLFRIFRHKFYLDEFYLHIVRIFQDAIAAVVHFFDEFIINGLLVGGLSRATAGIGGLLRRMQSGNIQYYALLFGAGILLVVYLTVFLG
jgi:NADH-quinone oxidoreductase subunit L